VEKDRLIIKSRTVPKAGLKTMAPDKFTTPEFGLNIEFLRGPDGKITDFTLGVGRAGGIEFVKK